MLLWRTMRRILVEFSIFWDRQLKSSYLKHSLRALGLSVLLKCFASFWSGSESKIISVVYQTRLARLLKMCFHISLEVVDISKVLPHSLWTRGLSSRIALPIRVLVISADLLCALRESITWWNRFLNYMFFPREIDINIKNC